MNRAFYRQTSLIEDEHWWFIHRRRLAADLLPDRVGEALDIGCGTGGNFSFLGERCSEIVGLDRSEYALELASAKCGAASLLLADANRLGDMFRESSFDLITAFNMLYHRWIEDDGALLTHIARLLRPGGRLLLTEAAFDILKRRHDVVGFGLRRYRRKQLAELVQRAGLEVRSSTYFNSIAFAPALLSAMAERLRGRLGAEPGEDEEVAEMRVPPRALNRALLRLVSCERWWINAFGRLPLGTGVLVFAVKADGD